MVRFVGSRSILARFAMLNSPLGCDDLVAATNSGGSAPSFFIHGQYNDGD
jgi:hypothetical protein